MDVPKTMIQGSTIKMHMPRDAATTCLKSELMPRSKMQPCDQIPLVDYVPL